MTLRWIGGGAMALVLLACGAAPSGAQTAPYAGQQDRAIAALSAQDIDDLLAGRGWGQALPAELNGWPGPAHVLELSDDLALTPDQRAGVQAVFDAMQAKAQRLGAEYVAAEAALDALFAEGTPEAAELQARIAATASLRADLRAAHLAAHLKTKPLLTRHQIITYNRLRGYGGGADARHGSHDAH